VWFRRWVKSEWFGGRGVFGSEGDECVGLMMGREFAQVWFRRRGV
jgi:hypothetical protein